MNLKFRVTNYFGTPPAGWSAWVSVFLSLAHGSELRGSYVYLHIVERKKNSGNFSFTSARVRAVGWPLLGFFGGSFGLFFFLGGSVGQIIYSISGLKHFL